MSYSADIFHIFYRAAMFVDKILKGARPADLPIKLPTVFETVINRRTATAMHLSVPPAILLREALDYMRAGRLVPDSTVLSIVRERKDCLRCAGGFLLDGFPRTVAQAEALDKLLQEERVKLDAVLNYELPIDEIVSRLSGRRTCSGCKAVFHVRTRPSQKEGVCDHCGGALIQREDDRPESVRVRMEAYEKSTSPLAEYYHRQGFLLSIPADGSPEQIYRRTLQVLGERLQLPLAGD